MSAFKWRQFAGEVILWAVQWYCRYGISYRELEEMLGERGSRSTTRPSIARAVSDLTESAEIPKSLGM
jgi:transposase-like protein